MAIKKYLAALKPFLKVIIAQIVGINAPRKKHIITPKKVKIPAATPN